MFDEERMQRLEESRAQRDEATLQGTPAVHPERMAVGSSDASTEAVMKAGAVSGRWSVRLRGYRTVRLQYAWHAFTGRYDIHQ